MVFVEGLALDNHIYHDVTRITVLIKGEFLML